ncbi:AsmA family protein [Psychroserpens damuponensis]|uniref:hypothetical protein n=1 Tax=Psychroserpens damuponensis TaxID=943936 RepID=UPI00059043D6|nr:hypothetical protein [Psychroserpens damuponensis]
MAINRKKVGIIFIIVFVLALVGLFTAKHLAASKFESLVQNLPDHINLQYNNADIDLLSGNLTLENPLVTIKGQVTNEINAQIAFKSLEVNNLSYWELYRNDAINLESAKLIEPNITYYHNKNVQEQSYDAMLEGNLKKTFNIEEFYVENAKINVFDIDNDSLLFSSEHLNIKLSSITSKSSESSKLPFVIGDFNFSTKNLKYQLNDFDDLFVKSIDINDKNSKLSEVKIQTKYSKQGLSKQLKTERDYIDLSINSIDIKNQNVVLKKGMRSRFEANQIDFNTLDLEVYRDKLIADDVKHKPLYSKMLRELGFDLDLNKVSINNGQIVYEEKVKIDKPAGKLEFSNFDATIKNVSNNDADTLKTTINISTIFMKDTPLNVNWNFDVSDINDRFMFKADIGLLQAEHLNQFMQPNLNLKLEGALLKTYFTIDGTVNTSQVDLKTDYDQFDVIILKDDGKEKNKFLSGLVNLFISKDSKNETDDFRESDTKTVDRDKTKSVFNYVWKNAQSGLLSAMAGDGKKE